MTSDHLPICGSIFSHNQQRSAKKGPLRVSKENLPQFAKVVSEWLPPLPSLDSVEQIENFAQGICRALKDALKAVGKRRNKASGRAAPWWTLDCKEAHLQYRSAASVAERNQYEKSLRATVAAAKREHWKRKVEAMKSSSDVFGLMRWAAPTQMKIPPPLMHEGRFIWDQAERAEILRDTLLARCQASDDLAPCSLSSVARIPWTEDLSDLEWMELPAACWKDIGTHVTQLFRACVRFGYHPSCFKLAEVVFLQKPGRDPSLPKGWRPISLLSCLEKGLERLLAKRMLHLAIVCDIVGEQQFGALPKRSANDLVSCVVHDIEEARTQKWASTFVTLDVQGAFDAVLHNRLLRRMQAQGWPEHILRWTSSFLTGRLVQVRHLNGVTSPKELFCGVPQGSPISPLLFLLYMTEPMRSGNTKARFSYADDVGILGIGRTIQESAEKAQQEVDSLLDWAQRNVVLFEVAKSEVIQFPGRAQEGSVGIRINGNLVEPAEHIRWLGVHLDQKLSFKHHVTTWCSKALKAAQHMRRLNSVKCGAAPGPLVTAVNACIVPVATFGAEVWWPGLTRETTRGTVTPATSLLKVMVDG
ncbi:hypothetical protein K3495_g3552 [Podosphaera aphanis]|nr:hypothetical protein K3495_g3552 [Podosphaera aphanis]